MVVVCNEPPFVFLKTRKTAGTSIEMFLESAAGLKDEVAEVTHARVTPRGIVGKRLIPEAEETPDDATWFNHMPARTIRDGLGRDRWDRSLKFTAVRDPFARTVSQFNWRRLRRGLNRIADRDALQREMQKFLERGTFNDDTEVVTIDGRYVPDRTVRFERLADDMRGLCETLGLPFDPGHFPVTKSSEKVQAGHTVADHFTEASIRIVHERLRWIFDNFDYPDRPRTETKVSP